MDLMPILSTLRRHKTAASLIVLEIALTSAIVCNALHLISTRIDLLNHDTGLPESELVVVNVRGTAPTPDADDVTARDLAALRALPGVKGVTLVNQMVYGANSNNSGVKLEGGKAEDRLVASQYAANETALATLGLKLVAGRDFKPEEYQFGTAVDKQDDPKVGQVIINRAMADKLFPGRSALGQAIYVFGDTPSTIVGVVEQLPHPYPARKTRSSEYSMMFPLRPTFRGGNYVLRAETAQRDGLIKAATAALEAVDRTRIVTEAKPLTEQRATYYAQDRAMVGLMGGVIIALMVVTAFGIVGLASFWVAQRTRMIGTRRALGATRAQIRGYFQLENFMLSGAGIVLGMAGALGLSLWLMNSYEMPRLPLVYLPVGAVALWALGQLAVLAPARRAAALPPVAALRS
jgi:putative ABC transport system permease protein